jgi:chitodextrinase
MQRRRGLLVFLRPARANPSLSGGLVAWAAAVVLAAGANAAAASHTVGDTQGPSVPQGLTMTGATESSISLAWNASTDNVGVAGYRLYQNGTAVAATTQTSYTYTGLACGTSYTLALEAFDAARNVSNKEEATTIRSTTACPSSGSTSPAPSTSPDGPASVFVATNGSDANPCTQASPCLSLNRAYRVAQPGQVVEVAGGFYANQTILADSTKSATSSLVVIRPVSGTKVTVNNLRFEGARSLAVKSLTVADATGKQRLVTAVAGATNILLENMDAANFYVHAVKDFTIRGGDWGPCLTTSTSEKSNEGVDGCSNSKIDGQSQNVVVEDAVFHDYRILPGSGAHFECMFIVNGTNVTIRRNKFQNCEFYDIFIQDYTKTGNPTGLVIENNWFDTPWNGAGVQNRPGAIEFSPRGVPFKDVLIRNNSFINTGMSLNGDADGTVYSNFRVVGNIAKLYWAGCTASITFRFNLWVGTSSTCATTDRTLTAFPYVNPVMGAAGDYHLTGGIAVDFMAATDSDVGIPDDVDRGARPVGAARDAGSDELR